MSALELATRRLASARTAATDMAEAHRLARLNLNRAQAEVDTLTEQQKRAAGLADASKFDRRREVARYVYGLRLERRVGDGKFFLNGDWEMVDSARVVLGRDAVERDGGLTQPLTAAQIALLEGMEYVYKGAIPAALGDHIEVMRLPGDATEADIRAAAAALGVDDLEREQYSDPRNWSGNMPTGWSIDVQMVFSAREYDAPAPAGSQYGRHPHAIILTRNRLFEPDVPYCNPRYGA